MSRWSDARLRNEATALVVLNDNTGGCSPTQSEDHPSDMPGISRSRARDPDRRPASKAVRCGAGGVRGDVM
jgi:hypothetical protein